MMNYNAWGLGTGMMGGLFGATLGALILPLALWSLVWKGWALWKAAKADSKVWFVVLLLVNTIGILDILYIFVFSSMKTTALKTARTAKPAKRSRK